MTTALPWKYSTAGNIGKWRTWPRNRC